MSKTVELTDISSFHNNGEGAEKSAHLVSNLMVLQPHIPHLVLFSKQQNSGVLCIGLHSDHVNTEPSMVLYGSQSTYFTIVMISMNAILPDNIDR